MRKVAIESSIIGWFKSGVACGIFPNFTQSNEYFIFDLVFLFYFTVVFLFFLSRSLCHNRRNVISILMFAVLRVYLYLYCILSLLFTSMNCYLYSI